MVRSEPNATEVRKGFLIDRTNTAEKIKQGIVHCDKIADLRREFDDAIRIFGYSQQPSDIDCENNARGPPMSDDAIGSGRFEKPILGDQIRTQPGIHAFNDHDSIVADIRQNADGPQ